MSNDVVKVPMDTLLEMILQIYLKDIKDTVRYFVRRSDMPRHTEEDIVQETMILLMENLPKYDHTKSSIRTYIINQTKVAGLRYRRTYFKMYVPEWEINHDTLIDVERETEEEFLREYPLEEKEVQILLDRSSGYTFKEIEEKHKTSSRPFKKVHLQRKRKKVEKKGERAWI